jgi:hypothetical protein
MAKIKQMAVSGNSIFHFLLPKQEVEGSKDSPRV